MKVIHYTDIHNSFKINDIELNKKSCIDYAHNLIKNGKDYEIDVGLFLLDWFNDKPFIETKTSGTTGSPKNIKISKQAMVNSALATAHFFELEAEDSALHCLPSKFIAGKMMLVRAIVNGFSLDIVSPSGNPLATVNKDYKFAAMVPLQVTQALDNLNVIDTLIIGGASVSTNLAKALLAKKTKCFETYGMTETVTHIAAKRIGEDFFQALPNVSLSVDERNCLVIEAPTISEESVITNDIVDLKSSQIFKWLGRFDNVINSGGVKLFPEQIEAKIGNKIPFPYFIGAQKCDILGEKVVLVIESSSFEVTTKVFDNLGKYEIPKEIYFVSSFLRTETGKINRIATLKEMNI